LFSKIKPKLNLIFLLFLFLITIPLKNFFRDFIFLLSKNILNIYQEKDIKILKLEKENLMLSLKLKELEYLKEENEKLKKALDFKKNYKINCIGTEIITFDPSFLRRIIVVNSGKNEGIKKGMCVVDENGYLVGKVIETEKNYSYVSLINDIDFNLVVFVGKDSYGLLHGGLEGIKILYVENNKDININDKVYFKIPNTDFIVYVGNIKNIKKNPQEPFLDLELEPYSKNIILHKIFILKYE